MHKSHRRRRFSAASDGGLQIQGPSWKQTAAGAEDPEAASPLDPVETGASTPVETGAAASSPVQESAAGEPGESANPALPFRAIQLHRSRAGNKLRFTSGLVTIAFGCLLTGLLAGYLLPHPSERATGPVTPNRLRKEAAPLTAADQAELDAAYTARHTANYAEAEQLFRALESKHPDWSAMPVEVGRTLFYSGDLAQAKSVLNAALERGLLPAEANFLLGTRDSVQKNDAEAETSFAKATALDPTEPNYYYFWGECLRKQGKLLEATDKFRSALLRNQYETAEGLYRLKLWLCVIEAGREKIEGVDAEIDAASSQPLPPMEALFALGARSLKLGDLKTAVQQIIRARPSVDIKVFRIILNDPIFAPIRSQPELAEWLQAPLPIFGLGAGKKAASPTPPVTGGSPPEPPASEQRLDSPAKSGQRN